MIYDFLGKTPEGLHRYKVTLKIYRDCGPGTADFDGPGGAPALLTVRGGDGSLIGVFNIGPPVVTKVPPTINSSCMSTPNSVCVEQGVYTYFLDLPPRTGGYYLIYQRCCRNHSILNLNTPGRQGSSYYAFIPGPEVAEVNSSPRFTNNPPIFLCNNFEFSYTQSATDPDGDQLIYKFSTPFQGLDDCCPVLGTFPGAGQCLAPPPVCPQEAGLPPYPPVQYVSPFNAQNPAPANPPMAIHPLTGAMSGAPSMSGQFVINVCVEEYRAGILISKHFRDFQFNILNCSGVLSQFKGQEKCQGFDFNFTNSSFNGTTFLWNFGVPGTTSDTSSLPNPKYIYPDTGQFIVTLVVNPGKSCSDTSQRTVRVYPPLDVHFKVPDPMCLVGNRFSFKAEGSWGPTTTFSWFFGNGANPPTTKVLNPAGVTYSVPGTYLVHLTARHFACVDSVMDSLHVLAMPQVEIEDPGILCIPAHVKLRNRLASDSPLEHHWRLNTGKSSKEAEPVFLIEAPGNYSARLVGTTYGKCRDTALLAFKVNDPPVAEFDVYPKTVTVLEPEINVKSLVIEPVSHHYTFGDGTSESFVSGRHSYYEEGEYVITQYVTDYFGCRDSISDVVKVLPEHRFWIPDAFTPDQNSRNETFGPFVLGVSDYELQVFDRWGERVFHSSDPTLGWDGTFRGKPCPQGIYTFKLVYKSTVDGTPGKKAGYVSLLRSE